MAKRTKKKRGIFGFGPMGWLIAILLLIGGGGFGLSELGFFGDGGSGDGNETSITTENSGENEGANLVNITVSGNDILWNNESVTLEEVATRVTDANDSTTYTVTDDSAIKATYEDVLDTLNENQVEFQEAESQL